MPAKDTKIKYKNADDKCSWTIEKSLVSKLKKKYTKDTLLKPLFIITIWKRVAQMSMAAILIEQLFLLIKMEKKISWYLLQMNHIKKRIITLS